MEKFIRTNNWVPPSSKRSFPGNIGAKNANHCWMGRLAQTNSWIPWFCPIIDDFVVRPQILYVRPIHEMFS